MIDDHMGDFILSLPTIDRLTTYFKDHADLYVAKQHSSLACLLPNVRNVIAYDHKTATRRSFVQLISFLKILLRIPFKRYQAVFFVSTRITESSIAVMSLSPRRIGLSSARRKQVYTDLADIESVEKHIAHRFSSLLPFIGDERPIMPIHLTASEPDKEKLAAALLSHGINADDRVAVIHPTAGLAHRCWPEENFARVADRCVEAGMKVSFVGTNAEQASIEQIILKMANPESAVFLAQPLTRLLALFERGSVLFSNESGPTHLAATTDIPIVTITGPTDMSFWKPFREENLTLLSKRELCSECGDPRFCTIDWPCIKKVTVKEAVEALEPYL